MALSEAEVREIYPIDMSGSSPEQLIQWAPFACALAHLASVDKDDFTTGTMNVLRIENGWRFQHPGLKPQGELEIRTIFCRTALFDHNLRLFVDASVVMKPERAPIL